jgi:hypothetical protein
MNCNHIWGKIIKQKNYFERVVKVKINLVSLALLRGWLGDSLAYLLIESSFFLVIGTHWIREIVCMLLRGKAEYTFEPLHSLDFYDSSAIEKLPSPRVLQVHDVTERTMHNKTSLNYCSYHFKAQHKCHS